MLKRGENKVARDQPGNAKTSIVLSEGQMHANLASVPRPEHIASTPCQIHETPASDCVIVK